MGGQVQPTQNRSSMNGDLLSTFANNYAHFSNILISGGFDVKFEESPNTPLVYANPSTLEGGMLVKNYDPQILFFEGSMGNPTASGLNISMFDNIGGTGDGVSIFDKGAPVQRKIKGLNFIGEGVTATVTFGNRANLTFTGEVTEINWTQQKW